jgi:hypothetical protein
LKVREEAETLEVGDYEEDEGVGGEGCGRTGRVVEASLFGPEFDEDG